MAPPHRSGPLKQANKKHKSEKKPHKGDSNTYGVKNTSKTPSKRERRQAAKQMRMHKITEHKKRIQTRGRAENPLVCALIPLTDSVPLHLARLLIQNAKLSDNRDRTSEILLPNMMLINSQLLDKSFRIVSAEYGDIFGCVDLVQFADWNILLVPSNFSELSRGTEQLLTALYSIGLKNFSYAVLSASCDVKEVRRVIETRFPMPEGTIYPLNESLHVVQLLRHIASSSGTGVVGQNTDTHSAARFRSGFIAESMYAAGSGPLSLLKGNYLSIQGQLRGAPIVFKEPLEEAGGGDNPGPMMHLPGWGDFPLHRACWKSSDGSLAMWASSKKHTVSSILDPIVKANRSIGNIVENVLEDSTDSDVSDSIVSMDDDSSNKSSDSSSVLEVANKTDSSDAEKISDDELSLISYAARTGMSSRGTVYSTAQLTKFRQLRMEEEFPDEVETPVNTAARIRFAKYRSLPRFRGSIWPVDQDTLPPQYDNIACFKNYHRNRRSMIRYLSHRCRKIAPTAAQHDHIPPNTTVDLTLGPMNPEAVDQIIARYFASPKDTKPRVQPLSPLIVWSLLPHERRISVCHFTMHRVTTALQATSNMLAIANAVNKFVEQTEREDCTPMQLGEEADTRAEEQDQFVRDALVKHLEKIRAITFARKKCDFSKEPPSLPAEAEPVRSKELMLFQAGIRRFVAAPIYSTMTSSSREKAKMEQFFSSSSSAVVAAVYGPVMYAPVNVLQFRIRVDEDEDGNITAPYLGELVATGSLHSIDPGRLIIKRILLSGHPYRINKRQVTVRFMFFNPTDIDYFKAVPLSTKLGALGHIKESVGTHGHMKCVFDRPINSADVVLMPLYKRVYPKWVYQPLISQVFRNNDKKYIQRPKAAQWVENADSIQLHKKKNIVIEEPMLNAKELALF